MEQRRTGRTGGAAGDRADGPDVAVVGAGLAGLTAALTAARAGARVEVFEARDAIGGRARSEEVDGFVVNHGAHALYRAGAGTKVLRDLGLRPEGALPRQSGMSWWLGGELVPVRKLSAIGGLRGVKAAKRLVRPGRSRVGADDVSMAEWLDSNVSAEGRPLAEMLVRTSCYAADLSSLSAGAVLDQVGRAARGVLYLDGGWQSLVEALEERAREAGVRFTAGRVEAVRVGGDGRTVELEVRGSGSLVAGAVVLSAGGAAQARSLLGDQSSLVSKWASAAEPILAACLDVALPRAARRSPTATYGLGAPVYVVDHARSAEITPKRGSVQHALFYEPDRAPDVDHRAVLEGLMDHHDPGWRDRAVSVTYRKRSVVAHDRIRPGADVAHPTVAVCDMPGVFVAGDWLTGHGMLADAPITSGAEAGTAAAGVAETARSSTNGRSLTLPGSGSR